VGALALNFPVCIFAIHQASRVFGKVDLTQLGGCRMQECRFRGKADMTICDTKCPLMTQSGHRAAVLDLRLTSHPALQEC
jgi:hypothetical protein